jgi:transposase
VGRKKRVNKYPRAFRRMALERMKNCASVSALADELGVHGTVLYHWQRQQEAGYAGTPSSAIRWLGREVRDLKRVLAEQTLEVDFFKGALQKVEARRQKGSGSGATASTSRSGK